jgi:hypothetical protein
MLESEIRRSRLGRIGLSGGVVFHEFQFFASEHKRKNGGATGDAHHSLEPGARLASPGYAPEAEGLLIEARELFCVGRREAEPQDPRHSERF